MTLVCGNCEQDSEVKQPSSVEGVGIVVTSMSTMGKTLAQCMKWYIHIKQFDCHQSMAY